MRLDSVRNFSREDFFVRLWFSLVVCYWQRYLLLLLMLILVVPGSLLGLYMPFVVVEGG